MCPVFHLVLMHPCCQQLSPALSQCGNVVRAVAGWQWSQAAALHLELTRDTRNLTLLCSIFPLRVMVLRSVLV